MDHSRATDGRVGLFWMVEEHGSASLIALAVPLGRADRYGDMLTVGTGHADYWSELARRGAPALRTAGFPTAPVWSDYDEWPRGRVIYDCNREHFIVRADIQLHRPEFVRIIAERFRISGDCAEILRDDHYRSVRCLPTPEARKSD